MNGFVLAQRMLDLADLLVKGAAAMPLIIVMGLVFGRRGNGVFCLWGSSRLAGLAIFLSLAGPLCILGNYLLQMLAINARDYFTTFFSAPGLNYSLSLFIWLAGMALLFYGARMLECALVKTPLDKHDQYELKNIKKIIWPLLLAATFFFATFITGHWPFAGFPAEISEERVVMAILRNAARTCFMAFAPAGALACAYAAQGMAKARNFNPGLLQAGIRWCALWAFVGYLPYCLQNLGIMLGAGARANAFNNQHLSLLPQIFALGLLLGGIACFALMLFKKKSMGWLAYAGLAFFLGARILPHFFIAG